VLKGYESKIRIRGYFIFFVLFQFVDCFQVAKSDRAPKSRLIFLCMNH